MNAESIARQELYDSCLAIFHRHHRLFGEAATGSGKTYISIKLIKELPITESWDIVVAERLHIQTWKKEFAVWGEEELLNRGNIRIYCYASLHKYPERRNVICDEADHITVKKSKYLQPKIKNKKCILLTASVDDEVRTRFKTDFHIGKRETVLFTLDKGVATGILAPYKITVLEIYMDTKNRTILAGTKDNPFYTTEAQAYRYLNTCCKDAFLNKDYNRQQHYQNKRMHFIYNAGSKFKIAELVLKKISTDKRVLIFASNIAQAEKLCKFTHHSKKKDDTDYQNFLTEKINRIAAVKNLKANVNIPNLEYGVITQVKSKQRHLIQEIGRLLRKTQDPNKIAQVVILVLMGTKDEIWLQQALKGFDSARIKRISLL